MTSKPTTTSTTSNNLTAAGQSSVNNVLSNANNLYNSGSGSQAYTGNTVSPFSSQQTTGFNNMMRLAGNNQNYMQNSISNLQNISGGNANRNNYLTNMAGGAYRYANNNSYLNNTASGGQVGQNNNQMMQNYASGQYLDGRQNPTFNAVLNRTQDDAQNRVNMGAASAGRYGSGVHQGSVAREVAGVTNKALSDQYNREVGYMQNANQQVNQRRQQDYNNVLSAAGYQSNNYNANVRSALAARNSNLSAQSNSINASNALGNAYRSALLPSQTQASVGQQYQRLNQNYLNQNQSQYNAQNNAGWNQLARLVSALSGNSTAGGTSTTSTSQSGGTLSSILGNLISGGTYLARGS